MTNYVNKLKVLKHNYCYPKFSIVHLKGIQNVLKAAKECIRDNFQSFYQVLSGAMHFEEIIELQAECPMVLAYSETPGTGE